MATAIFISRFAKAMRSIASRRSRDDPPFGRHRRAGLCGRRRPARLQSCGPKGLAYAGAALRGDTESHVVAAIELVTGHDHHRVAPAAEAHGPEPDPLGCALARPHGVFAMAGVIYWRTARRIASGCESGVRGHEQFCPCRRRRDVAVAPATQANPASRHAQPELEAQIAQLKCRPQRWWPPSARASMPWRRNAPVGCLPPFGACRGRSPNSRLHLVSPDGGDPCPVSSHGGATRRSGEPKRSTASPSRSHFAVSIVRDYLRRMGRVRKGAGCGGYGARQGWGRGKRPSSIRPGKTPKRIRLAHPKTGKAYPAVEAEWDMRRGPAPRRFLSTATSSLRARRLRRQPDARPVRCQPAKDRPVGSFRPTGSASRHARQCLRYGSRIVARRLHRNAPTDGSPWHDGDSTAAWCAGDRGRIRRRASLRRAHRRLQGRSVLYDGIRIARGFDRWRLEKTSS